MGSVPWMRRCASTSCGTSRSTRPLRTQKSQAPSTVDAGALGFRHSPRMMSSWRRRRSSFCRMISRSGAGTTGASLATVSSEVAGLSRMDWSAPDAEPSRSASQSSTGGSSASDRSAVDQILSGSEAADRAAVSRTPASASKDRKYSIVARSPGATAGTSPFAPIMRSATGALASTCLWRAGESAWRRSGQSGNVQPSPSGPGLGPGGRMARRPPVVNAAQHPVQPVAPGQEGEHRPLPRAQRLALRGELGVPRVEGQPALEGANRPDALPQRHGHPRLVDDQLRLGPSVANRPVHQDHAQVGVLLDQHQREPVPGLDARVGRGPAIGLAEHLVGALPVPRAKAAQSLLEGGRRLRRKGALRRLSGRRAHAFISWMSRRPSRVRCSSTSAMAFDSPATSGASPPVATTRAGKASSACMRSQMPSTSPTYP